MLVALTVRKLKPGSYEQFRKAWEHAQHAIRGANR